VSLYETVWRMFYGGMSCKQIDRELGLGAGEARRMVKRRWKEIF
jgi:transposase